MQTSLFLHYGPGGNSYVENQELSRDLPEFFFWDQPKVKTLAEPFFKLSDACVQQIVKMQAPRQLVGHSFGCDLIASASQQRQTSVESTILISPLQNIPLAFQTLGEVLHNKKNSLELRQSLDAALNKMPALDPATFWGLVTQVATHPLYQSAFWQSKEAQTNYETLALQGPAFDAEEWQTLIQDYLFNKSLSQPADFSNLKSKKTLAIFGELDPYFKPERDLPFWQNLLGKDQVITMKNCGHFPHLENKTEFLKIIRSLH